MYMDPLNKIDSGTRNGLDIPNRPVPFFMHSCNYFKKNIVYFHGRGNLPNAWHFDGGGPLIHRYISPRTELSILLAQK